MQFKIGDKVHHPRSHLYGIINVLKNGDCPYSRVTLRYKKGNRVYHPDYFINLRNGFEKYDDNRPHHPLTSIFCDHVKKGR